MLLLQLPVCSVNLTRYDPNIKPPFTCGFEGVGEVVQKGPLVRLPVNQPVAYMSYGAFGEYQIIKEKEALPLPDLKKEYLTLLVSGLTAGISLEKTGEIKAGIRFTVSFFIND